YRNNNTLVSLTLFVFAGFTQGPNGIRQCYREGGFCFPAICPILTRRIGRCRFGFPCCRKRVSSGFHKADITL
uniref:Beta-defensin-like domain-containing protein n=1 Tax=Pelusios castaneus TaxID=367368 RepID=A0A8C8RSY9_9SAUR